jgi:glucose-1-phosphate cytidylyltransferase
MKNYKVVILAGGLGTRLSEETIVKPKPMVNIGNRPMLWHIMKIYSHYGFNDFIICVGYLGNTIKEYFNNYNLYNSNLTFDLKKNRKIIINNSSENWKVTIIDTGLNTNTGGRLKRINDFIHRDETFLMTYGDGLANIDIKKLLSQHIQSKTIATVTAVKPIARFGSLKINKNNNLVSNFSEKITGDNEWINGGFFVFNKKIFDYIDNDLTILEKEPLEYITKKNNLSAYIHKDFWHPMDTLRDKTYLDKLYRNNEAPWKIWKDD